MTTPIIQTSFNSGEWAPALNARVDLAKYHSGAALLRNWFVDYRGGATTRPGTKYIANAAQNLPRLVPFQASATLSYVLEFGDLYIRFFSQGAQILIPSGPFVGQPYAIGTPYRTSELFGLKFTQNINTLIITHPNHQPYVLTLNTAADWTLAPITFGATIGVPVGTTVATTLAAGPANYTYVVTAVDTNGQESGPSSFGTLNGHADMRSAAGTNTISWAGVIGAVSYNVYKATIAFNTFAPSGTQFGLIANVTGTSAIDTNLQPDFTQTPPISNNPLSGGSVTNVNVTVGGSYVQTPSVAFAAAPGGGTTATGTAAMSATSVSTFNNAGVGYNVGDFVTFNNGVVGQVTAISQPGVVTGMTFISGGQVLGAIPALNQQSTTGSGANLSLNAFWTVTAVAVSNAGSGYTVPPTVSFSFGGAVAVASISASGSSSSFNGNPTCSSFFNQRLYLAGMTGNPQQFAASQPGAPYNFDENNPITATDAIFGTLAANVLNSIQNMVPMSTGLIAFTDRQAWLINGGSPYAPATPINLAANSQAYNGANGLPPIVDNYDMLYVQAKGSVVRDLTFNFYTSIYTGTDISIISSHLFYGFTLNQWDHAQEPFKLVWVVRSDGTLLTLTFMKEQELVAWAHSDTQGLYRSVAVVAEETSIGLVDAVYVAVQRSLRGQTVTFIERFVELIYPFDYKSSWQVDAGIGYNGSPATHFTGAGHLSQTTVVGVADGVPIEFLMPGSGEFQFGPGGTPGLQDIPNASIVTIGYQFTPQLQTLALDMGEPTVQGKRKRISGINVRVANTLGLSIGRTFNTLTQMKDLVLGNVGSQTNALVTGLVTGDARTIVDPYWDAFGQYCIQQNLPYPASVLGVMPEVTVGDSK